MIRARADVEARLVELIDGDDDPDLAELALLVSAHGRPSEVDVEHELSAFDALAAQVPEAADVADLVRALFVEAGFRGDVDDYYSADNSRIDVVMDRRKGIPLSLAVVTCAVGRRVGLRLAPVGLPGHVVVGAGDGSMFIDVFDRGRTLTRADCSRILETLHPGTQLTDAMLQHMSPRAVVVRMLNNLVGVHQRRGSRDELLAALQLRDTIHAAPTAGAREQAEALAAQGRLAEAAAVLENAAEGLADPDATALIAMATRYRAKLN